MEIFVNGESVEAVKDISLSALIESMKLNAGTLVAELNGDIVPRSDYKTRRLSAGDQLELIRLVGGG